MKKIISLLFVLSMTLTASAQYWYQHKSEADELKGTQERNYHAVKIPDKCIISIDDNIDELMILTLEGIFDFERFGSSMTVVDGLFGMYNEKGELTGKEKIMLWVSKDSPEWAMTNGDLNHERSNVNGIKKVADWIRNNKGSIRIVIPRYGKTDFDVTLPTMQSQKEPSSGQAKQKGTSQKRNTKSPVRRK